MAKQVHLLFHRARAALHVTQVDLAEALGAWPEAFAEYAPPRYLPIATALFVVALMVVSRVPFVLRMMRIADPFFEARTRPWEFGRTIIKASSSSRSKIIW